MRMRKTLTNPERGAVTTFFAVLAVSFLMTVGLVVDGGRKLGALAEVRDLADNAARTCAQAVNATQYRASGTPTINPTEGAGRAHNYLAATGATGSVTVTDVTCTVTVTKTVNTTFLPLSSTVHATESASTFDGVTGP